MLLLLEMTRARCCWSVLCVTVCTVDERCGAVRQSSVREKSKGSIVEDERVSAQTAEKCLTGRRYWRVAPEFRKVPDLAVARVLLCPACPCRALLSRSTWPATLQQPAAELIAHLLLLKAQGSRTHLRITRSDPLLPPPPRFCFDRVGYWPVPLWRPLQPHPSCRLVNSCCNSGASRERSTRSPSRSS